MSVNDDMFVPIVLTNLEAVAAAAACMVVGTSSPIPLPIDHPVMQAGLKIEAARREAAAKKAQPTDPAGERKRGVSDG